MASVLNRTTNEYKQSANTVDYPQIAWLYNPDVSAVLNETEQIQTLFWIIPESPPQQGAVITANRVAWKTYLKQQDLVNYREELRLGPFHFDLSGDHTIGDLYDPERFDTGNIVYVTNSMTTGVAYPSEDDTLEWDLYSTGIEQPRRTTTMTDSDFINFHSRFDETREEIRKTYFLKYDEIFALTTEEELDAYDVTEGWPFI